MSTITTFRRAETKYKTLADKLLHAMGAERSQKWLADCTYVSPCAVHQWLSGKCRPGPDRLGHIAALLGMPYPDLDELLNHAHYPPESDEWGRGIAAYKDWCSLYRQQRKGVQALLPDEEFDEWLSTLLLFLSKVKRNDRLFQSLTQQYPEVERIMGRIEGRL